MRYFIFLLLMLVYGTAQTTINLVPEIDKKELKCLTDNVYHEARGEGTEGMLAVARVTVNRKDSKRYPKTVCKVVYQPHQFSWTESKRKLKRGDDPRPSQAAAWAALVGWDGLGDAKDFRQVYHYKTIGAKAKWAKKRYLVKTIGRHQFYRGVA